MGYCMGNIENLLIENFWGLCFIEQKKEAK